MKRIALALLVASAAVACSSTIVTAPVGADAGKSDSSSSSVACTPFGNAGSGGGGSCDQSTEWTCGSNHYTVQCACPADTCKCIKNGTTSDVIAYPYSCSDPSNCDRTLIPSARCGFPTP